MTSILREYLLRSSFHGLHFLVDPGLHWTERLFWLLAVLGAWVGCAHLMLAWMEFAYHNPVSLSLDNDFLKWRTPVPAIVVCETNTPRLLYIKDVVLREKLAQRIFFEYYLSTHLQHNYTDRMWLFRNHRSNCSDLFNYCSWQNEEFDCCNHFLPIESSMGTCFAFNSIQTNNSTNWNTLLSIQREHGNMILEFKNPCIKIYAVSNDEIVTENEKPVLIQNKIGSYIEYKIFLSVTVQDECTINSLFCVLFKETVSEKEIKEIDAERRKCRFADENYLDVARNYSFDACKLQCQKNMHLKLFNCTQHYMPFTDPKDICNETQLYTLLMQSKKWRQMAADSCHCELGCIYNEVLFLGRNVVPERTVKLNNNSTMIYVHIDVVATSTKMIRRQAHSMITNVVNVGGAAGLFLGASILSIVEIFYYFTIRAFNSYLMDRKKRITSRTIHSTPVLIEVYPFAN